MELRVRQLCQSVFYNHSGHQSQICDCVYEIKKRFHKNRMKSVLMSLRCWQLSTRRCLTTTSIWRARCSNPTWWPPGTPAPKNSALKKLPWQLSLPCAALCPLLCQVRWTCRFLHTQLSQVFWFSTWPTSCASLSPPRCDLLVWWSEWGGGHPQPERHQPVSPAPALGPHLLLWSGPAGLSTEGLGREEGEWQGLSGRVHQESPGKERGGRWRRSGRVLTDQRDCIHQSEQKNHS